jgi:large subunit ribosomal protein L6
MSKIGKNPIQIPDKTDVSVADGVITVKGPLGTVSRPYVDGVLVAVEGGNVMVTPKNTSKFSRSLWGTTASHVKNMIKGVTTKYEKKLELQGVGYKVELQGTNLKLSVGFSHPVMVPVPQGVTVVVEKTLMTITGIDKDAVGQFAANVRAVKKPEPYKGKGIRYVGEYVREKQGKKAVG